MFKNLHWNYNLKVQAASKTDGTFEFDVDWPASYQYYY